MEGTELLQRQKTTLRSLVIIALFLLCPIGKHLGISLGWELHFYCNLILLMKCSRKKKEKKNHPEQSLSYMANDGSFSFIFHLQEFGPTCTYLD